MTAIQACITDSTLPLVRMGQMTLASNQRPLLSNGGDIVADYKAPRSGSIIQVFATQASKQCPRSCGYQCHIRSTGRTPHWLKGVFGQLMWTYNSSISLRSCNLASCRKSVSKHNFTYRFPSWLISRAIVASVKLGNLSGAGAKISINIPLIIPEEDHIVWSLVIAGNIEQLCELLSRDGNLMYVKNQWGQSIMHVSIIYCMCFNLTE